jgi:hypothetical protein
MHTKMRTQIMESWYCLYAVIKHSWSIFVNKFRFIWSKFSFVDKYEEKFYDYLPVLMKIEWDRNDVTLQFILHETIGQWDNETETKNGANTNRCEPIEKRYRIIVFKMAAEYGDVYCNILY